MTTTTCSSCGGDLVESQERTQIRIGSKTTVVDVTGSTCSSCGETFYTPQQLDAAQIAASNQLRKEDGLLGPADIRRIRARYGLTQAQLEQLLGVGPKTVVRWERGTVCQSRTADELLRIITDMPFVYEHLARKNGITTQSPPLLKPQQTSRYVTIRMNKGKRPVRQLGRRVIDLAEFVARAPQKKQLQLEREAALPQFPAEALR
jgi:HTH-type transcriptional regulator/antitoxin MqsA